MGFTKPDYGTLQKMRDVLSKIVEMGLRHQDCALPTESVPVSSTSPVAPVGYSNVPPGHIASVVTCLEMVERPDVSDPVFPSGIRLDQLTRPDLNSYRTLYRKIGADWLWFSRLVMDDQKLASVLSADGVEVYVLRDVDEDIGMIELDFRQPGECEIVFLGVIAKATGNGLGRALMNWIIRRAWSTDINRLWLHTCTFDHPSALGFYKRSGFRPYAFQVEIQVDPRLTGHLPPSAAPHVPLIDPNAERP